MTVNKCILVGNLGRDAEIRNTGGGTTIANLRLATTDRRKAQDGTWQDHTEWHAVVAFGKTAEVMEKYGKKGKMLYVEGRIQTREYTDKDGNKRWSTEIVANEIRMLGGKGEGEGQGQSSGADRSRSAPPTGQRQRQPEAPAQSDGWGGGDEELPF
jgi:single-strand DNA-binding protein